MDINVIIKIKIDSKNKKRCGGTCPYLRVDSPCAVCDPEYNCALFGEELLYSTIRSRKCIQAERRFQTKIGNI